MEKKKLAPSNFYTIFKLTDQFIYFLLYKKIKLKNKIKNTLKKSCRARHKIPWASTVFHLSLTLIYTRSVVIIFGKFKFEGTYTIVAGAFIFVMK